MKAGRELFLALALSVAFSGVVFCFNAGRVIRSTYLILAASVLAAGVLLLCVILTRGSVVRDMTQLPRVVWLVSLWIAYCSCHDFISLSLSGERTVAFISLLTAAAVLAFSIATVSLSRFYGRRLNQPIAVIGTAGYCAVNVVAYKMGFSGTHGANEQVSTAIVGTIAERMIAPFGTGLNNFGIIAVVGAAMSFNCVLQALKMRAWLLTAIVSLSAMVCLYACYLVQIRSALIVLASALSLAAPLPRKLQTVTLWLGGLGAVFSAWIFLAATQSNVFAHVIDLIGQLAERSPGEAFTLGGRVFIWEDATDEILSGSVGLMGQSIAQRDYSSAFGSATAQGVQFTMTAHNGLLDVLSVYGYVGGLLFLIIVVRVIGFLVKRVKYAQRAGVSRQVFADCGSVVVLLAAGFSESVYSSLFFTMILLFIVAGQENGDTVADKRGRNV